VVFTNELRGDAYLTNAVAHNGSGVAIGDYDGDGLPDLYFCGLENANRLYRNRGGWVFEEVQAGEVACDGQYSTGAVWVDVDGDGDLDLLVNGISSGTRLFLNDGDGGLVEEKDSGLSRTASSTSMALADVDGDGDLDLYCAHYIDVMHLADPTTRFALARDERGWRVSKVNGQSTEMPYWKDRFELLPGGRVRELPEADGFYRNIGGGRFEPMGDGVFVDEGGRSVGPFRDWGLSVMFRDLNGDGAPDFYVCNDNASPDRLWMNLGDGRFREAGAGTFRHTSRSSMALDFADVDRDGRDDLLVLDMLARASARRMRQLVRDMPGLEEGAAVGVVPRYNRNMLFMGRGDGSFVETALMAGVAATDWAWCPVFMDVDLDGYEDLLVSNGFSFDVMDQDSTDALKGMRLSFEERRRFRKFHPSWLTANAAFRNRGDGSFESVGQTWGFAEVGISNGMATGDLDGDGDLDVVVNNLNGLAGLYRNDGGGGLVAVRLRGRGGNGGGVGARVRLTGAGVVQSQEVMAGGRYLSGDEGLRVFGVPGDAVEGLSLEVVWRSGRRSVIPVEVNRLYEVDESGSGEVADRGEGEAGVFFEDVSPLLGARHEENEVDDWLVQPLLPRKVSRLGPGLAWADVDGDGWEDLVVAAAAGEAAVWFRSEGGRTFKRGDFGWVAGDDLAGVVYWPDGLGGERLLMTQTVTTPGAERGELWELRQGGGGGEVWGLRSLGEPLDAGVSPGGISMADVDLDGDLDVFVAGRLKAGRYPEPVGSAIWLNEGGELRRDAKWSDQLGGAGLVNGSTFCDLDGDGYLELVLAVEWGAVRIFRSTGSGWVDTTERWGLAELTGLWTGVVAGDFDGDGRPDLVVGNWGRNSLYELDRPERVGLFYGDFEKDGVLEVIEAGSQEGRWYPLRSRTWLARGMPDLVQRYPTHEAYGLATVEEILGERLREVRRLDAVNLETTVFLNRGGRFEAVALPAEVQRAPVFGVAVGDYDSDGREDIFLGQNFYGGGWDLTREDAGGAMWLRGRGDGTFEVMALSLSETGEQRSVALADYDHDGRVDMVVGQSDGPFKLVRNLSAGRGLRVRLVGPGGNPHGVGARMRVVYEGGQYGAARWVQAGSGYWGQDSVVCVMGVGPGARELEVVWPDGGEQRVALGAGVLELEVIHDDVEP
jgi:hypothetical protein